MPHGRGPGWTRLTATRTITEQPCWLLGLVLTPSVAGAQVAVYNAHNADAEELVDTFEGPANASLPIVFAAPLPFSRGLHVTLDGNVTSALIIWAPMKRDAGDA